MKTDAFIERSRFGKRIYLLRDERLEISGRRGFVFRTFELELKNISARIERRGLRFYRLIATLLGMGLASGAIPVVLLLQEKFPSGAVIYFVETTTGIFSAGLIFWAIWWIPRVEIVRFKTLLGATVLDMIKEKRQAVQFEDFIELIRGNVRKNKEPNQTLEPTPPSGVAHL